MLPRSIRSWSGSATRFAVVAALAMLPITGALHADEPLALLPSRNASPAISAPVLVAEQSSCASTCQARHDQCRVATKGSPSCDSERQQCLQACLASKKQR
jgi:hypothetical protein